MDFERANSIGTGGERLVAETLQRLSVRYDFRQLDNVMLKVGKATSQIDHLVIDQSGIVIIESKVRNAAHIKGQDGEKMWTACYPGGTHKSFQNPLRQNQWHDTALRQVLRDADISLEPDYIDTLVVFVGADLSGLGLRDAERQRVLDVGQLDAYFGRRAAKAEDRAPLVAQFVHDLLALIAGEDRSRDEQTMAAHAAHRAGKATKTAGAWAGTVPERATPRPVRGASSRSVLDDLVSRLARLALVVVTLGLFWLFAMCGGLDWLGGVIAGPLVPPPASSPAGPTIAVARQRLKELSPDVYAAATDLDSPAVASRADGTAFTWHYLSKPKPNTVVVHTFTLVLGADGAMRSMGVGE